VLALYALVRLEAEVHILVVAQLNGILEDLVAKVALVVVEEKGRVHRLGVLQDAVLLEKEPLIGHKVTLAALLLRLVVKLGPFICRLLSTALLAGLGNPWVFKREKGYGLNLIKSRDV